GNIQPASLNLAPDRAEWIGDADPAWLFSVAQGLVARTDSGFSKILVDGLAGDGRAKGWYEDELYVKFDRLWEYVKQKLRQPVDPWIGGSRGLILRIDPIPPSRCRFQVRGASASDRFTYIIKRRDAVVATGNFRGTSHEVVVAYPGDYHVELRHASA